MTIKPLHDKVLIKRVGEEEKTKGGIIIPDTAKEKPQEGKIVACGQGKRSEVNGEEHVILSEDEILGILE
jgi:chaperonin GroES